MQLVLCSPLCFLVKKYSQSQAKILKTALLDFYDGDSLSKAKLQLLTDFNNIKQEVGIDSVPHIAQRRDGDNRAQREVDDMLTLLTALDERLLLNKLPMYVSDGPDKMPATRLYEGDFSVIMTILEKMEGKLTMLGSALSAISRDVHNLQVITRSTECTGVGQSLTVNKETLAQPVNSVLNIDSAWPALPARRAETNAQSIMTSSGDSNARLQAASSYVEPTSANDVRGDQVGGHPASHSETRWSALASTPQSSNRFAVLASTVDEVNQDDRPYTTVRSQRAVRAAVRRRRQQSELQQQADGQSSQPASRQKSRVVTGQSSTALSSLWAAKKIIKKAVFCIDNVNLACNENDIRGYVSGLGAEVFSCFKTNPRRRPNESVEDVKDRRAFRLCVNAADRDRLLQPDVWPDSIRISDWFFVNKNSQQSKDNDGKRQRLESPSQLEGIASLRGSTDVGGDNNSNVGSHCDERVTENTAASSAGVSTMEVMVTDAATSDGREVDDDDAERTTIYQHGVC